MTAKFNTFHVFDRRPFAKRFGLCALRKLSPPLMPQKRLPRNLSKSLADFAGIGRHGSAFRAARFA